MPRDGVATHTAHAVLSAAAFADFQAEVVRLQASDDDRTPLVISCGNPPQAVGAAPYGPTSRVTTSQVGTLHGCNLWSLLGAARRLQVSVVGTVDKAAGFGGPRDHSCRSLGSLGGLRCQVGLPSGGGLW